MGINILSTLGLASVALVVLIDLATGQGPPIFNSYMQAQQDFRPPPPPMHPVAFMQPANYPPGPGMEKEYRKAIELGKGEMKSEKKFEKEMEKEKESGDQKDKYGKEATPAPGVLSSFSNSMNDAWKSISTLGRSKRATPTEEKKSVNTTAAAEPQKGRSMAGKLEGSPATTAQGERGLDSYEYLQHKNQGYVYFKVPKYLVCNY